MAERNARQRRSGTVNPHAIQYATTGSAMTTVKREPTASANQNATSHARRGPASSARASSVNATAADCATNHTSPSIEHHSRSVPANANAVSQSDVSLGAPRRRKSDHAAPVATPASTHANSV